MCRTLRCVYIHVHAQTLIAKMTYSFRSSVFLILCVIGAMSVTILITHSGYLSRKRVYIQKQENGHQSREALRHYRTWTKGQHHLPKDEENAIPGKDVPASMRNRALSSTHHPFQMYQRPDILDHEDDILQLFRTRSNNGFLRKTNKVGSFREEDKISIKYMNNRRWTSTADGGCMPRKDIAFVKMHKCSSTTVQNILFRYGERHGLDFVLPPTHNILGRTYFHKRFMIQFPVEKYNVLCHHTRFSAKGFAEVMSPNAVYTTILRDPVRMYESSFTYNDIAFRFNLSSERGLEQFMQRPLYFYKRNIYTNAHVKNPMLYDLGLPDSDQFSPSKINRKIQELTEQFDLVMITEYFDESLILLCHLMCWETDDMVYFVLNARSKSSVTMLSPDLGERIRDWNAGDVKLYNVFNQTFWKRVEEFGTERLYAEVDALRERIRFFHDHCIARVVDDDFRVWHPHGIKIDSFTLRHEVRQDPQCNRMIRPELPYTQSLRVTQLRRYNIAHSVDLMT